MKNLSRPIAASLLVLTMTACAGRHKTPDFYPNEKLQHEGRADAEAASLKCMSLADQYVEHPDRFKEALKTGLKGGVVGAGTGAVGGAIFGEAGRGTGAGAAIGGILGVLKSLDETGQHSPTYERFVERCLQKEGYEVVGWSDKSEGGLG